MKKVLNIFFVTLGIIFFVIILAVVTFVVVDPYNLKPLLFGVDSPATTTVVVPLEDNIEVDKNPVLSDSQEEALEKVGINPADVPSSITSEQEECFIEILGQERVDEITAGDSPTAIEIFKAGGCI